MADDKQAAASPHQPERRIVALPHEDRGQKTVTPDVAKGSEAEGRGEDRSRPVFGTSNDIASPRAADVSAGCTADSAAGCPAVG